MPRRSVPFLSATGLALGVALTACGSATDGATARPSSLMPGPTTTSAAPSTGSTSVGSPKIGTPTVASPTAPVSTPPRGPATTVTGTVTRAAIEGSCLVLATDAGSGPARKYLLIADSATLRGLVEGAKASVSGRPEPGMATACQTGTPFLVEQVLPSSGNQT